ncbi:pyruvate decarboxylase [Myriangium duriaei CBS 260.36]|uniref:Pyruvate decarboxylase n=1 Tax=Myriangium duriaei CBS 260.36 TaxID=1168546 RepID=A0A9P4MKP1_9PEZI|nr:pyruvate decarboxylase [Myriangium duriaei CBS 260.36]
MPTIPLGEYLWRRIAEVGVGTVMGLPGDFNLQLLDHIYNVKGLRWIGNANELNAAYAVDGYARVKNVPGCIVTTHGVGELSALNGIAGAMTEQVKVIHVVGQTARPQQRKRQLIHHSIGLHPDHQVFNKASKRFRVDEAELWEPADAPAEIDRVIRECFLKSGPVYIFIPLDIVDEQVSSKRLKDPIDLSPTKTREIETIMRSAVKDIAKAISKASNPMIFVDCLLARQNVIPEARKLIELLGWPVFQSGIAMGIVDPTSPQLVGNYIGSISAPGICAAFDSADLLLVLGRLPSDTNTGGFTQNMPASKVIEFHPDRVDILGKTFYPSLPLRLILPYVTHKLTSIPSLPTPPIPRLPHYTLADPTPSPTITHSWFWSRFSSFLQPHDIIVSDTGTSLFGLQDCRFPRGSTYHASSYYSSIGFATPAALGAELARQEMPAETRGGRTVLVTGDGAIQLTSGEISTMIAAGAPVVVVLVNNRGYTVERAIHGAHQGYNDIPSWKWGRALEFHGMEGGEAEGSYVRCETREEFEEVIGREDLRRPEGVKIVEVIMGKLDAPWKMLEQIGLRGEKYREEMRGAGFVVARAVEEE